MNYLITIDGHDPYFTKYFTYEDNYLLGMKVYDLSNRRYTINGKEWYPIPTE